MVRSKWKKALVVSLTWAGLAWAQQPTPSGPAATSGPNTGQYFTVQEAGKPGQKCKVIKTWKTPDGKTAYQVQAVDSGEMMTIVENGTVRTLPASSNGSGSRVQAVATRIFHWGSDSLPPSGTPLPPVQYVQTMPSTSSTAPRPAYANMTTAAAPQPAQLPAITQSETAKPIIVSRPWPTQTTTYTPPLPRTTDSRIAQAQTNSSSGSPSSPAPTTQAQTAGPNIGSSTPQKTSPSTSSVNQPATAVPDNRFSSTPITQPKVTFPNTPTSQPAVTVQNRPITTPDKPSTTSAPAAQASSPYYTATPTTTSSTTRPPEVSTWPPPVTAQNRPIATPDKPSTTSAPAAQASSPYYMATPTTTSSTTRLPEISTWPPLAPAAPQRVVQVVPPKSDTVSPPPSTSSTAPAAAAKSAIASGQTAPVTPSSKPAVPLTNGTKPADTTVRSGGQPTYQLPSSSPATNVPAPSKTFTSMPSPTPAAPAPIAQAPNPAFPPYPSSWAPTPAPAASNASPPVPKNPAPSVPPSSFWSQSGSPSTTTATPSHQGVRYLQIHFNHTLVQHRCANEQDGGDDSSDDDNGDARTADRLASVLGQDG